MHLALANFGYTEKPIAGSGGTKGYGKTALARNSGTRTVICYSAFNPSIAPIHPDASHDDGNTTRRIFGMGYWKKHNHRDGLSLNGWHRFGYSKTDESETNKPAVDAEADTLAKALGMPIRDAQKAEDIGSTFMIIDPIMDADSLVDAVRRWWWPAIVDRKTDFDVTVTDFDGRELKPNPSDDPELEEFVRAYRLKEDLNPKTEHKVFFQEITVKKPNEALKVNPGVLHLVADPSENGWTNPYDSSIDLNSDEGISVPHASIIALIRKTKMVVRYSVVAKAKPFIRGVFVSDPSDANELLAWTEDALHSNWEHEADEDRKGKTYCFDFAKTVLVRIASNTNAFRDKFRQAGVSSTEVTLNEFDRIMNPLRGRKKTKARKDPKEVSKGPRGFDITYPEGKPEPAEFNEGANDGLIKMPGLFKIALDNDQSRESGEVEIQVRFQFEKDGKSSSTEDYLGNISTLKSVGDTIEWVEAGNGTYTGKGILTKNGVTITAESAAYEDIFTGGWKPVVTGKWEINKGANNDE